MMESRVRELVAKWRKEDYQGEYLFTAGECADELEQALAGEGERLSVEQARAITTAVLQVLSAGWRSIDDGFTEQGKRSFIKAVQEAALASPTVERGETHRCGVPECPVDHIGPSPQPSAPPAGAYINESHQQECQLRYITAEEAKRKDYGCTCPESFAPPARELDAQQICELPYAKPVRPAATDQERAYRYWANIVPQLQFVGPDGKLSTVESLAAELTAAYERGRLAGLEEAAKICDDEKDSYLAGILAERIRAAATQRKGESDGK